MRLLCRLVVFCIIVGISFNCFAAPKQEKPTVMIMINEQIWVDDRIIYDYYGSLAKIVNVWTSVSQTDTTFMQVFLDKGFRIVGSGNPNTTKGNVSKNDMLSAIEGDDFTSTNLGNYLNADVIIVGRAIARGVSLLAASKQKSARANITIRAIKVSTGEIIAVESGDATAAAIDAISAGVEAIKRAAEPLAQSLVKKIMQEFQEKKGVTK